MRICFYCNLIEFKPKGNVLQFFILLRALDRKLSQLPDSERQHYSFECVLPFRFRDGMGGFTFQHIRFFQANDPHEEIIARDRKKPYDFIFIRGRNEAVKLLRMKRSLGSKLLFLAIQYNLHDPYIMRRLDYVFRHSRVVFFQTEPNAERYRLYQLQKGSYAPEELLRKIQVLPQFVEPMPDLNLSRSPSDPLDLIQAGVIRPRYGLPVATKAIRLIRKDFPDAKLRVLYPSIVGKYRKQAEKLLRRPGVADHGQKSMWKTKEMIVKSGIGVALLYDKTEDRNPSHSYLSRILEYMGLGVPVLTTRTVGNLALLGNEYPLFVEDAYDIAYHYERLTNPSYYEAMCQYVKERGSRFLADEGVKSFWTVLQNEYKRGM
ncbi:glycosyltransferase family 1 protein [Brevibacillus nitrificans]|uniref:glycosyltransferase family 1 protein n=1 Tax=Brevibacillus nitrificans TaxID=651560 RepID=UPI0026394CA7|nr:glycosyltransferase family 1 protein [Brevibacillus nitrificans]MED1796043.1 glycosyltransferase family 1 protein [Brevibacillus nitrificans]